MSRVINSSSITRTQDTLLFIMKVLIAVTAIVIEPIIRGNKNHPEIISLSLSFYVCGRDLHPTAGEWVSKAFRQCQLSLRLPAFEFNRLDGVPLLMRYLFRHTYSLSSRLPFFSLLSVYLLFLVCQSHIHM